jgi:hypothetical protein
MMNRRYAFARGSINAAVEHGRGDECVSEPKRDRIVEQYFRRRSRPRSATGAWADNELIWQLI